MSFAKTVKDLQLWETRILNSDKEVPLEDFMSAMPQLCSFKLYPASTNSSNVYTSNTTKVLAKLPKFKKLKKLRLHNVPETFDFLYFAKFYKVSFFKY